jgi:hypothetical protein
MRKVAKVCGAFAFCWTNVDSPQISCEKPAELKNGKPWKAGNAIVFRTQGLAVDADGAPNSYLIDGNGLSHTCEGVVAIVDGTRVTPKSDPRNWEALCRSAWADALSSGDYSRVAIFGFLTDKQNHPLVQQGDDPFPGKAYISVTTMTVPDAPEGRQRHWVDATKIPYIVLTASLARANGIKTGDVAVVYRPKTGAFAFGVYADQGSLGEASVKLHRNIGNEPISKAPVPRASIGIEDPVVTLVFPGTNVPGRLDAVAWSEAITAVGKDVLEKWGGVARLQSCAK